MNILKFEGPHHFVREPDQLAHPLIEAMRDRRIDLGWTQSKLAAKLHLTRAAIQRRETKHHNWNRFLRDMERHAKALDVKIEWLIVPTGYEVHCGGCEGHCDGQLHTS